MKQMLPLCLALTLALSGCQGRSLGAGSVVAPSPMPPAASAAASSAPQAPALMADGRTDPAERDWRLMLVNGTQVLTEDFDAALSMTQYGYEVDSRIVEPLDQMISAATKDGISLIPCYGYRTLAQSAQLFEKQINRQMGNGLSREAAEIEAKKWVAPPGTSDHHTGLALDIVTLEHQVLNHAFSETPAAKWMAAHCFEYGFVIRFPADKQEITGITYEPWHLRYVGAEHAAVMQEKNLCLEEYWQMLYGEDAA